MADKSQNKKLEKVILTSNPPVGGLDPDHLDESLSTLLAKYFKAIAETTGDMIHLNDTNGHILYANPATEKILGYALSEFVGSSPFDIIHPDDREKIRLDMKKCFQGQQASPQEIRLLKKDGTYVDVEVRGFILRSESSNFNVGAIISDISSRKKKEKELKLYEKQVRQSEKLAAVGKLASCIAHEFNNPMCGIQNVLEGIQRHVELDGDYQQLTDLALVEINRVKNLIKNLQSYNRPSDEKKEQIDLHGLIDEIILMTGADLRKNNIEIKKIYADALPKPHVVPDQIKQVILNLIFNARDAIPEHGVVTITTEADDSSVHIHFADSGHGIEPAHMDSIFEPFYTTKPVAKGTGLGLSISDGIIKGHGGIISVSSKPDVGSTFTITLPIKENTIG